MMMMIARANRLKSRAFITSTVTSFGDISPDTATDIIVEFTTTTSTDATTITTSANYTISAITSATTTITTITTTTHQNVSVDPCTAVCCYPQCP
jgi:hypothetical protein